MVQVEIDTSEFEAWVNMKKELIAIQLESEIVLKIKQLGLVDKSGFVNSIKWHTTMDEAVVTGAGVPGYFLEWGTTSHFVMPTTKKALHWKTGGKNFFSKGHMVKGIKAYAPFRRGLDSLISRLPELLK